jgi:hypothetical protein
MVAALRRQLLLSLLKACAPSLPLPALTAQLGFRSNRDCYRYLFEEMRCCMVSADTGSSSVSSSVSSSGAKRPLQQQHSEQAGWSLDPLSAPLKAARTSGSSKGPSQVSAPAPKPLPIHAGSKLSLDLAAVEVACKPSYDRVVGALALVDGLKR